MAGNGCQDERICGSEAGDADYRRVLMAALAVNLAMAVVEIGASVLAGSVALQSDALDFLGDAASYALGLVVLSRAGARAPRIGDGRIWTLGPRQCDLSRAIMASPPRPEIMSGVGFVAPIANMGVAALLFRHREGDSNRRSVWLCTRNDAIANVAVILAGVAVWLTRSSWPDLVVAGVIAALCISSALQVARQALRELRDPDLIPPQASELQNGPVSRRA